MRVAFKNRREIEDGMLNNLAHTTSRKYVKFADEISNAYKFNDMMTVIDFVKMGIQK